MPEDMTPELVESDRLTFAGALTIRDTPRIHGRMREVLAAQPGLTIDCRAATEIDLTFIQLLLSARTSAAAAGKSISFIPPEAGFLGEMLARAGLKSPRSDDRQFWLNKASDGDEDHSDGR